MSEPTEIATDLPTEYVEIDTPWWQLVALVEDAPREDAYRTTRGDADEYTSYGHLTD